MTKRDERQLEFELAPVTWAAMQVLDGSFVLTPNEKRLLFKMYGFCCSEGAGCYASITTLGDRLGLSGRTVKNIRTRLRKLGLLSKESRRGKPSIWRVLITRDCIPKEPKRVDPDEFMRYRERVDNWLEFQARRIEEAPAEGLCEAPAEGLCKYRGRSEEETPLPSSSRGGDFQLINKTVERLAR